MSKEGLELAALYSCRLNVNQLLSSFKKGKATLSKLQTALEELPNFHWYEAIASFLQIKDVWDERVVRAYWTGDQSYVFMKNGSKEVPIFHNFIILDSVRSPYAKVSVDECKISLGTVIGVKGDEVEVAYDTLTFDGEKFHLYGKTTIIKKGFLPKIKSGDWVTFHVGVGREKTTEKSMRWLCERTVQAINLFNQTSQN